MSSPPIPPTDVVAPRLLRASQLGLTADSRGQPITWLSSPIPATPQSPASSKTFVTTSTIPCVSFLNPQPIAPHTEVFNNYGPKSNEELLLSYGFVIPDNPDDTLILRLGSAAGPSSSAPSSELGASRRFALRRDGEVPVELLRLMRTLMGGPVHTHGEGCGHDHGHDDDEDDEDGHAAHEKEMEEMQLEMDVLGELGGMLEDKLEKLRAGLEAAEEVGDDAAEIRDDVRRMVEIYRQGELLDSLTVTRMGGVTPRGGCHSLERLRLDMGHWANPQARWISSRRRRISSRSG